jgi:site-specific DNA recombinase
MDGYIRQSRSPRNGEGISPDQQRERIANWAAAHGVDVVEWHMDIDQSGKKLERPGLDALLARVESGATEGVIVAKLDRLSRAGLIDTLRIIERIHGAGAALASDDFGLDPTAKEGEFMLGIILGLARLEWRRAAEDWDDAKTRAATRGAHIGPPPLGYSSGAGGRLEPNELAPHVSEMFNIAARDDVRLAVEYAREAIPGRRWTTSHVRRTLSYRTYLGETGWNGNVVSGAHEALTDLATWTRAQHAPEGRTPRAAYPLSGVCVCGTCGTDMVGSTSGGARKYRCASGSGRQSAPDACGAKAWAAADQLEEWVRGMAVLEAELREGDAEHHPEVWPDRAVAAGAGQVQEAQTALESAQLRRDEFAASDLDISPEAWAARARALDDAVGEAREEYERALEAAQPAPVWPTSVEIARAPVEDLPAALERLGLEVRVRPGRDPLPGRVELVAPQP